MTTGRINQVSHRLCCVCCLSHHAPALAPPPSIGPVQLRRANAPAPTRSRRRPHRETAIFSLRLPASSGPLAPLARAACWMVQLLTQPSRPALSAARAPTLSRTDSTRRCRAYSPDTNPAQLRLPTPRARRPAGLVWLPPAYRPPRASLPRPAALCLLKAATGGISRAATCRFCRCSTPISSANVHSTPAHCSGSSSRTARVF